jgi:regulator of nucleoside diphosphate kinase
MNDRPIYVTRLDAMRLRALLRRQTDAPLRDQDHLRELLAEIERAIVVEPDALPPDVITMGSHVWLRDLVTGTRSEYTLVFPAEVNVAARRLSVLAPLGTALLGYRQGDEVVWDMPGGVRRLRVELVTLDWESAAAVLLPIQPAKMPLQLELVLDASPRTRSVPGRRLPGTARFTQSHDRLHRY